MFCLAARDGYKCASKLFNDLYYSLIMLFKIRVITHAENRVDPLINTSYRIKENNVKTNSTRLGTSRRSK